MAVALLAVALAGLVVAGALLLALRRARSSAAAAGAEATAARADAAAAERRRAEVMRGLSVAVMRLDGDARLAEANPAARERFPFLEPGMGILEAFSEHRLARRVRTSLERLERQAFEVRLFADGRRTYRVAVEPYELGGAREALVLMSDLSEAVDYQELRSQFVANVSHELRTPLTGLGGLLEALEDPGMDDVMRQDFLARAIGETRRLEALIGDVLFLSELEATQGRPSDARSDLARTAAVTVQELTWLAADQNVTLRVEGDDEAWTPLTDRMADTVVRNLVTNAIKYAGPGATATVTVRRDGGSVVLRVADDGAGVPERHLPHIFERFYRADPSRSKRLGGTGLGLSIVKHIAERVGGAAEATSREGFGTTITITVPAADPAPSP
ncbi:sensor histidine kinase [Miltoncostaea marina]|uniref:sensor histidine kinase n=1 Tax=Miltoncostaea marina TaxID=2843215 RepID=UPI001C3CC9C6|nr:ATP-binding protein [Miltoncostaea marina]